MKKDNKNETKLRASCGLAVYPRERATIKAIAATLGVLPADVIHEAFNAWIEKQGDDLRAVVQIVEQRMTNAGASS